MPLLTLAIPYARTSHHVASPTSSVTAGADDIAIDMQQLKNQVPRNAPQAREGAAPLDTFRRVFECRLIPVNEYFDHALAEFVTPPSECAPRAYGSNAALRASLTEVLRFHPHGRTLSLDNQILGAGLPSLLRDETEYMPGTLAALRYDVGANSIKIGRFQFHDAQPPCEAEFLIAGDAELAFLQEGNPHASRVREDHASILDFHYRAAGMKGHTALPPTGSVNVTQDQTQLSDFTAQLARCHRLDEHIRTTRATNSGRYPAPDALDMMQNGLICSIL